MESFRARMIGSLFVGVGLSAFVPGAALCAADGVHGMFPQTAALTDLSDSSGPSSRDGRHFESPEHQRGIYLNAWAAGSSVRTRELIELARRTEINTFVIDVKDASGYVSYPTGVALAREVGADQEIRIRNISALLDRLEAEQIWPIARIVVFKDPLIAQGRSDLSVQDSLGGTWVDGRGDVWVNPWDEKVWDYHVELAREAIEMGFREIQWDYVRFPDRPASELAEAVFPGSEGRARSAAIREFLLYARRELADLDAPLTADIFGIVTSVPRGVGIGQVWEEIIDAVDAALPMVYPSHYYEGSFGLTEPNAYPYEVVLGALRQAKRRASAVEGAGRVVPWLQDFSLGSPAYGPAEVRAQIQATYEAGISEWILWNASSRYTEGALEPVAGWPQGEEPPIRIEGRVTPPATAVSFPVPRLLPVPEVLLVPQLLPERERLPWETTPPQPREQEDEQHPE